MNRSKENLLPVLGVLYPWRRKIMIFTIGVFILSCLGSLLLKNYYQGKTVFYAASQDLFKPEKIFGMTQQEMYYYGVGEDIDRILTIGNSHEILDFLIDSFDLWTVYEIKPGTPKAKFKMRKALEENYSLLLTKQDALELTIEDHSPERAAAMANAATTEIDNRVRNVMVASQLALASSVQHSIGTKEKLMHEIQDSLIHFRQRSGIYDPKSQTEILATRVTEVSTSIERERASLDALKSNRNLSAKLRDTIEIISARIAGYERELNILNSPDSKSLYNLNNFNHSKNTIELMEARHVRAYEQISHDLEKLKLYNTASELKTPAIHLIERAEVPLYKSRPKRSVIVFALTLAAFLFSIAGVLVYESYRKFNWKEVLDQARN